MIDQIKELPAWNCLKPRENTWFSQKKKKINK